MHGRWPGAYPLSRVHRCAMRTALSYNHANMPCRCRCVIQCRHIIQTCREQSVPAIWVQHDDADTVVCRRAIWSPCCVALVMSMLLCNRAAAVPCDNRPVFTACQNLAIWQAACRPDSVRRHLSPLASLQLGSHLKLGLHREQDINAGPGACSELAAGVSWRCRQCTKCIEATSHLGSRGG